MQCTQIQELLDEYLDGKSTPLQKIAFEHHVSDCNVCRQHVLFAQQLQRRLVELPYPPASKDFESRVLHKLPARVRQPRIQRYGFVAGFSTALAASLGLWLVLMPPSGMNNSGIKGVINLELVAEQTQPVNLVFNSPVDIENATLRLELPANIELAGYRTKQQLEWQTSLRKGSNRLVLPLIAHGKTDRPLLASITSKGKTRTFMVNVTTRVPSAAAMPTKRFVSI